MARAGRGLSKGVIGLSAFVVGAAVGAALVAGLAKPRAPTIVYVDRPREAVPDPVASNASSASVAEPAPSSGATSSRPLPSTPTGHPSQLGAERAILDEARSALMRGDPGRALNRVEAHRRIFPNPLLGEERDAMEIEALVALGRTSEARTRAEAFRRHAPDSIFRPTVDSVMESIP
jgi:hypothetical protein